MPCVTGRHQSPFSLSYCGPHPTGKSCSSVLVHVKHQFKNTPLTSTAKLPSMAKNTKPTTNKCCNPPCTQAARAPHAGGVVPAQEGTGEQLTTYV